MDSKLLYPYKRELYFTKLILRAMMILNKKVPGKPGTRIKLTLIKDYFISCN